MSQGVPCLGFQTLHPFWGIAKTYAWATSPGSTVRSDCRRIAECFPRQYMEKRQIAMTTCWPPFTCVCRFATRMKLDLAAWQNLSVVDTVSSLLPDQNLAKQTKRNRAETDKCNPRLESKAVVHHERDVSEASVSSSVHFANPIDSHEVDCIITCNIQQNLDYFASLRFCFSPDNTSTSSEST